jgi:sugar phosphate isomerase/epimerase
MYSRRDFGKIALAGAPFSMALGAKIDSKVSGVRLGNSTYSYIRDIPHAPAGDAVDGVIAALIADGAGEIELFAGTIEPVAPNAGRGGGRPAGAPAAPPDPAARAAAMRARMNSPEVLQAREDLRQWRLTTPIDHFKAVAKKFNDAGIKIDAYTMNYRNDFTDAEIDKTFEQANALGTNVIATSTQMEMARRLVPFAEKHKIVVALHGHSNTRDPEEFSSPETFQKGMDMSKYFKINLDVGHFFAAGFDPIAYINEHHEHITHLHMKDRKSNDGPNAPWGEGDTPLKQILVLLKDKKYPIPALVEYEYRGTGTSTEEVKKCMDYMRNALA